MAGVIGDSDGARIKESLNINGLAVIKGFLAKDHLQRLWQDASTSVQENYDAGIALGGSIKMGFSESTAEFGHPFLVSSAATELVTNPALLGIIESYLDDKAVVHHGLFQRSVPLSEPAVDWHVDTGSNKLLNGASRFPDRRLRMIVYLTDVKSGGLSYIPDSRDATTFFLTLSQGALFPQSEVLHRLINSVTINELAGTVILFDAHGLHRPEPPKEVRLVLNVWFARSDFSASLPPVLVSMANIPAMHDDNSYIFKNQRGNQSKSAINCKSNKHSLLQKAVLKIKKWLKNDNK